MGGDQFMPNSLDFGEDSESDHQSRDDGDLANSQTVSTHFKQSQIEPRNDSLSIDGQGNELITSNMILSGTERSRTISIASSK